MHDSSKIIIEFIGLPGSGKTYLSNKLYENLSSNYDHIHLNNISRTKGYFHLVTRPRYLYYFINLHLSYLGTNKKTIDNLGWILKNAAYHIHARLRYLQNKGVFIYDESVLHRIWSLSVFNKKDKLNFNYLDKLVNYLAGDENKLFVLVNIDADQCINRIVGRSHPTSRFNQMSEENVKKYISENYPVYEKITDSIKNSGLNYLELNGSNRAVNNINLILDYLGFQNENEQRGQISETSNS